MTHQFTINFTEEHSKYALRRFFLRYLGVGFPAMYLTMIIFLVYQFKNGKVDWLFGFCLAALILGIGIFVSAYFQRLKLAISLLRKMSSPTVHYELTDERIKAVSSLGATEVKWEMINAIWIFPKVWLLMFEKSGYLTLPADQINNEVKDFLKKKVSAAGGKIK